MTKHLALILLLAAALPAAAQSSPTMALRPSERFVAFRSHDPTTVLSRVAGFIVSETHLTERDTMIVEVIPEHREMLVEILRADPAVEFAGPTWFAGALDVLESRHVLTRDLVVRLHTGVDVGVAAGAVNAAVVRPIEGLEGVWVLRIAPGDDTLAAVTALRRRGDVVYAHADWLRYLGLRETVPNDPLFPNQWHLKNTGQGSGMVGLDIRATMAWDLATGQGTTIAVIDTGVDPNHIDLNQTIGYNPITGAGPTAGADYASHGTSCAGVAAASGMNGSLLTGAAPAATVMPIRLLSGYTFGTPSEEALCFAWAVNNGADVISNSWGPDGVPFLLPAVVEQAFVYATTSGRGGLGCPIFWAAGNGNENIVTDEYVASAFTIAVGAVTNLGVRASYSDFGADLDLVAPSSGGTRSIDTLIPGNFHSLNFGGTSAAAPQAAGVAALMIEANPAISWNEVRDAIRISARQIHLPPSNYILGHNPYYGHGLLDAHAAVLQAVNSGTAALRLTFASNSSGHLAIDILNMAPLNEWLLGLSLQPFQPLGSGPFLGIGWDGIATILMPPGQIPFHSFADATGDFHFQVSGVLGGFVLQGVAIEILPGWGARSSNCAEIWL